MIKNVFYKDDVPYLIISSEVRAGYIEAVALHNVGPVETFDLDKLTNVYRPFETASIVFFKNPDTTELTILEGVVTNYDQLNDIREVVCGESTYYLPITELFSSRFCVLTHLKQKIENDLKKSKAELEQVMNTLSNSSIIVGPGISEWDTRPTL